MSADELKTKQRLAWLDLCKGVNILLVLLGHTKVPFKFIIYGFHMPLFFVISGYLYGRKRSDSLAYPQFLKKNFLRYIRPYFILCCINLCVMIIKMFYRNAIDSKQIMKYTAGILYSRGTKEWMPNCTPLWFLTAMFCLLAFMYFPCRMKEERNSQLVILCCFCMAALLAKGPKLPWNADSALMGAVFFWTGFRISRERLLEKVNIRHCMTLSLAGIVCIMLNARTVSFVRCAYGDFGLMLVGGGTISISIMWVCRQICEYFSVENRIISALIKFGQHTIFFMAFDYMSGSVAGNVLKMISLPKVWYLVFGMKFLLIILGLSLWYAVLGIIPNPKIKNMLSF